MPSITSKMEGTQLSSPGTEYKDSYVPEYHLKFDTQARNTNLNRFSWALLLGVRVMQVRP